MPLKIYNSLSRKVEDFVPIHPDEVSMYVCGPTVYDYAHVGNFRTYTLGDLVYRILGFNGYKVKFVMNLTDVGHLTGDNLGDADRGEDRIEMSAEREGRSAKEISDYYINDFLSGFEKLNLTKPFKFTKATSYIKEQIDLIRKLEEKGYTYKISDGIYFDTSKFSDYGKLSGVIEEDLMEGARVEPNPEKKSPLDFALWKLSPADKMRWQEWDSPWGRGFPGWHIECSAMCFTEFGPSLDIHVGAEDLRMVHHQNEIAQAEAASGQKFVNYWMHGAFLQVDGGRMGKSLGNAYTISDVESKNFDVLSLRYFYLGAHYRRRLNFTWEALTNAQNALKRLYDIVGNYQEEEGASVSVEHLSAFTEAINDDINMPVALSITWDLIKSEISEPIKVATLLKFDKVLGLNIEEYVGYEIPQRIKDFARTRWEYRKQGIWDKADYMRKMIEEAGFLVEDGKDDYKIKRKL